MKDIGRLKGEGRVENVRHHAMQLCILGFFPVAQHDIGASEKSDALHKYFMQISNTIRKKLIAVVM